MNAGGTICLHRVKRADYGHLCASDLSAEGVHEGLHGGDGPNKGTIITVGACAAKGDEDGEIEMNGGLAPPLDRRLLNGCEELCLSDEGRSASRRIDKPRASGVWCVLGRTHVMNILGLSTSGLIQGLSDTLSNDGVMNIRRGGDAMARLFDDLPGLFGGHDEMADCVVEAKSDPRAARRREGIP